MTDLWKKHQKSDWNIFDTYKVTILIKDIVGGRPATAEMIEKWVAATCKAKTAEERARIVDADVQALGDVADDKAQAHTTVFARVDGGLAIEGRQVKAMLKEAANIIKGRDPVKVKNLRSKVADQVFVSEEYIPLGRTEPDEYQERPIHVMTAQGPRTSIKRVEMVKGAEVTFTVRRRQGRDTQSVPEPTLLAILDYCQTLGLGADRSQGYGTFTVQSVEKV